MRRNAGESVVVDDRPGNLRESDALDALAGLVAARAGADDLQREARRYDFTADPDAAAAALAGALWPPLQPSPAKRCEAPAGVLQVPAPALATHSRAAVFPWLLGSARVLRELGDHGVADIAEAWAGLCSAWNRAVAGQDLLQVDAQHVLRQLRTVLEAMLRAQLLPGSTAHFLK